MNFHVNSLTIPSHHMEVIRVGRATDLLPRRFHQNRFANPPLISVLLFTSSDSHLSRLATRPSIFR